MNQVPIEAGTPLLGVLGDGFLSAEPLDRDESPPLGRWCVGSRGGFDLGQGAGFRVSGTRGAD